MTEYPPEYDDPAPDAIAEYCFEKCKYDGCEWAETGKGKPCAELKEWMEKNRMTLPDVK